MNGKHTWIDATTTNVLYDRLQLRLSLSLLVHVVASLPFFQFALGYPRRHAHFSVFSVTDLGSLCALQSRPSWLHLKPMFWFIHNIVNGFITSLDLSVCIPSCLRVRHHTSDSRVQLSHWPLTRCVTLDFATLSWDVAHQPTSSVCCPIGCC